MVGKAIYGHVCLCSTSQEGSKEFFTPLFSQGTCFPRQRCVSSVEESSVLGSQGAVFCGIVWDLVGILLSILGVGGESSLFSGEERKKGLKGTSHVQS